MLILASASPERRRLLREAGVRLRVVPSRARETMRGPLREAVLRNARRKAAAVSRRFPGDWVLSADTMIEYGGRIYGKPRSLREAADLMERLAGRTHALMTGVVLRRGPRVIERVAISRVTFRELDRPSIERIVRNSRATRYAGGYAIRESDDPVVARVRGSFTNVVGLPMQVVMPLIRKVGLGPVRDA